ncbi:type IV pilin [Methanosarcina sp. DH2]|uniref:type IV pilin n=1 Tax=Methanosarcina sp. DH2 TaxID=2605639 RepID=UPI001E2EAF07|nr:type IV pilin [Methanosarcina sp. DH2]MCC4769801.1 type IV pilin [Methanosarcina sp. DH2]
MDLKKIFNNNKAVSPVIGVVLMVAITVILAAAIGSSVFGQGPSESAPQSNIDISVVDSDTIKFEHLGGDTIILANNTTKVMLASGINSYQLDISAFANSTFDVGMTKTLDLKNSTGTVSMPPGEFATVKVVDVQTSQLIADKELRF